MLFKVRAGKTCHEKYAVSRGVKHITGTDIFGQIVIQMFGKSFGQEFDQIFRQIVDH